jgi:pimeloyl-ACP methyl ester carboxylesterase
MNLHQPFSVPPPIAAATLVMKDGAQIRLRRYGKPGATRLVLSHGNGLAINAYAPFWLPLAEHYDVVVFDMRNHGENPLHDETAHHWETFYSDIEAILQGIVAQFGPATTVGVFHSLSSLAALSHTQRTAAKGLPNRLDAICLFDPPMLAPKSHALRAAGEADSVKMSTRAARRTPVFDSPDELAQQFRKHASFARWVPEGADLFARHTLRQMPDGRWTLRCPPSYEARVFKENKGPLFEGLPTVPIPLIIIAGDPDAVYASPAAKVAKAAHEELGIEYAFVPDTTHFLQIEEPQACRDLLIDFLRRHNLNSE